MYHVYPNWFRLQNFPVCYSSKRGSETFLFWRGKTKKFSRHNEKNLAPLFQGIRATIGAFPVRIFLNSSFCKQAEAIDKNLPRIHLPGKDFPEEKIEKIRSHIHLRKNCPTKRLHLHPNKDGQVAQLDTAIAFEAIGLGSNPSLITSKRACASILLYLCNFNNRPFLSLVDVKEDEDYPSSAISCFEQQNQNAIMKRIFYTLGLLLLCLPMLQAGPVTRSKPNRLLRTFLPNDNPRCLHRLRVSGWISFTKLQKERRHYSSFSIEERKTDFSSSQRIIGSRSDRICFQGKLRMGVCRTISRGCQRLEREMLAVMDGKAEPIDPIREDKPTRTCHHPLPLFWKRANMHRIRTIPGALLLAGSMPMTTSWSVEYPHRLTPVPSEPGLSRLRYKLPLLMPPHPQLKWNVPSGSYPSQTKACPSTVCTGIIHRSVFCQFLTNHVFILAGSLVTVLAVQRIRYMTAHDSGLLTDRKARHVFLNV
nr:trypsin-like proteinase prtT - Porphyromonas gingivalis [Porphyromonas gingivalis]